MNRPRNCHANVNPSRTIITSRPNFEVSVSSELNSYVDTFWSMVPISILDVLSLQQNGNKIAAHPPHNNQPWSQDSKELDPLRAIVGTAVIRASVLLNVSVIPGKPLFLVSS